MYHGSAEWNDVGHDADAFSFGWTRRAFGDRANRQLPKNPVKKAKSRSLPPPKSPDVPMKPQIAVLVKETVPRAAKDDPSAPATRKADVRAESANPPETTRKPPPPAHKPPNTLVKMHRMRSRSKSQEEVVDRPSVAESSVSTIAPLPTTPIASRKRSISQPPGSSRALWLGERAEVLEDYVEAGGATPLRAPPSAPPSPGRVETSCSAELVESSG